jgi:hypothetical protein
MCRKIERQRSLVAHSPLTAMSRIDQFRVAELDRQLVEICKQWNQIRRHKRIDEHARDYAVIRVQAMFEHGGALAIWANAVVDAFGRDEFPVYRVEPPKDLSDNAAKHRSFRLTGVDDAEQAGLRIILWAAASQDPLLLIKGKEWYHMYNYRESVRRWAERLVRKDAETYRADPGPMKWIRAAFDALAGRLKQKELPDLSGYVLASQLWPRSFESYKRLGAFLKKHPQIRTDKTSRQRLLIHAGDFHRAVAVRDKQSFDALDAPAKQIEDFLKESGQRRLAVPKKGGRRRSSEKLDFGK